MFKSTVIVLLAASASAMTPDSSIPADSAAGRKLLNKARALDQNRDDSSWMAGYSIKYMGCSSLIQVRDEAGGEDESNLYTMNMVKFGLCSASESCGSCGKGKAQYVVNMNEFIDAYTEMQMNAQEQACENVRENCYCDDANDDEACESSCYASANMDYCEDYEGGDEFEIQEYLECAELQGGNNNNNYNNNNNNNNVDMYQQYYVGPVCSDGFEINLATFYDQGCTQKTKSGVWDAFNYGSSLPFSKESIVSNSCISCIDNQNDNNNNNNNNGNNNNNNNNNYEIIELCENSVEEAAKCESGLSNVLYYADESGCDYIHNILPKLSKAASTITGNKVSRSSSNGGSASVTFAVLFALTTVVMGAYSFFLYRKIHRAKVNLASAEGSTLA
ncbi:MAG: hypothetical protein SGBAC_001159 [Bacillariaceae sp.]